MTAPTKHCRAKMRKLLVLFTITAALLLMNPVQASAAEGPCTGRWNTNRQVVKGIRCVWGRFDPGYGGADKALDVAWCESRYNPDADGGINAGLFQHNLNYWDGRFTRYITRNELRSTWGLSSSAYSGRTNAIVTALYVRAHGWGAWSCA